MVPYSPYSELAASQYTERVADDYGDRREEAAEAIRNRLYTDNYLDSADTEERRFLPHEMAVKHPLVQGSISAELLGRAGSV